MRQRVVGAAVIIVSVLGVSIGTLVLYNQSAGLRWGVKLGDEITYVVRVTGFTEYYPFNGSLYPPSTVGLNNTYVTIRIDSLPEIPSFPNGVTFAENILGYLKTAIIGPVKYMNGTEVVSVDYSSLNGLISHSILPVGNWPFIDSLYPDRPDMEYSCDTYLSSIDSSFMIGHRTFVIDAGQGWYASVDMNTGLPNNATVWASNYVGYSWYSYEITLTSSVPSPY